MYVFWRKTFFWKIYTFFLYYKFMYCATGFQVGYKQDYMIKNCPSVTKLVMFIYHFFLLESFFQRHQVTFSHWNFSVVCHLCCCPFALLLLWTFHISINASSPEPSCQFQPNLAQSLLGWREFKFVQMNGHTLFQG